MTLNALVNVFVYGTLKPGEANYDRYCANTVLYAKEAIAYGYLFSLPLGYPAMTIGDLPVYGFLLEFAELSVLDQLDDLEGYDPNRTVDQWHQNEYWRVRQTVFTPDRQPLGDVWMYQMKPEQVKQLGGIWLPQGRWSGGKSEL